MITHTIQLLWLVTGLFHVIQGPIFNTYSVKFSDYIYTDNWDSIPLNSARKNQDYIKALSTESKEKVDQSIALNSMKIIADLDNDSDLQYKIESIHLDIDKIYNLEDIKYEKGDRDMGNGQNYFHISSFNITTDMLSYIEIPQNLVLYPTARIYDSRIYYEVNAQKTNFFKRSVIQFSLKIKLTVIGQPDRRLEMKSDRKYFIAVI